MIYLDSAATTLQKPLSVSQAAARAIRRMASPGRGGHRAAMWAADTLFACREEAAALFHVPTPEQVVFTSNATHALNIAIRSLVRPGDRVVISGYEHNAVTRPLRAMPEVEIAIARAPLFDQNAMIEAFRRELDAGAAVAVCTHVSNVFGFILPIEEIAALCRERKVPLIVDASQSAGCIPLNMEQLGAAFVAMPGHKGLYGPQGTGLLLCGAPTVPLLMGGTGSESRLQSMPEFLPDRLEAGTHNVPGIAGLLEGLRFVRRCGEEKIGAQEQQLMRRMAEGLERLDGITVFRAADPGIQTGVLSFCLKDWDCESLSERLGDRGFALRAGLHCAPTAHETAGTLQSGTVRASVSAYNTQGEISAFLRGVNALRNP